jgi:hypothetical protein
VTKLNATGTALIYSTHLGADRGLGIAVDGSGNAYVTGLTGSSDFPTTAGAFQTSFAGAHAAFVTKLNITGTALIYSTYLGGNYRAVHSFAENQGQGIAVDGAGNAYVTGYTTASDFPTTAGAFQTTNGDDGGATAFVTKLNTTGTALIYSTYLGGTSGWVEAGDGIAVDGSGNAYVTGSTFSSDFPTTAGAFQTSFAGAFGWEDAFVTKLNTTGTALIYSTYLGGRLHDSGQGIAVDASGSAYVTGWTESPDFPTTADAFQTSHAGGREDAFVTKLNATGTALIYSTYLGGSGGDRGIGIAVDGSGNAYVTGRTGSSDFPTTAGAVQTAQASAFVGFVTKFAFTASGPSTTFQITAPATAITGVPVKFTVTALDQNNNPTTGYTGTVQITSTDGAASLPADAMLTNGTGTFSVTFNTAGSQTITARDTINSGITGTTNTITVTPPPPLTVTSFTPTPTGFTATFNEPLNPADLTMYGTGPTAVQDVTLVGKTTGPISGTLLVDPANTSITFKATANGLSLMNNFGSVVLPDDTYTVTLVSGTLVSGSGTNGFISALGASLDGATSGGHANYVTTFSTNYQGNATPVLSISDFARGPDASHIIEIPNDSGRGIPITLYNAPVATDAAGVTDVTFSLWYNPALLTVSGAGTGDSSAAGSTFTMTGGGASGTATFTFHNATPQPGTVVLGDVLAVVPNSAASHYKSKELLQLGNIVINHGAITGAVSANGVHVNAYAGDVTGNDTIDALDVALAYYVAQGKDTGFVAYPLLDPAIVGDLAGDYSVDAGDVSDLAAYVVNLPTSPIPTIPTGLTITPAGPDPTLSLVRMKDEGGRRNQTGEPTPPSSFILHPSVSVMLDQPHPAGSSGMTEAILALKYDPLVFSVSPSDITLGSVPGLGTGWQLTSVIDQTTGEIAITLYSTTPVSANNAGSLVNIAFHINPAADAVRVADFRLGSVQLVSSVTANGEQFTTQVDDAQGQYVLGMNRLVFGMERTFRGPNRKSHTL